MAFTGTPEDRQQIRERLEAYADAVFRRDLEAWLGNWSADCVWTVAGAEFRGKVALQAQWTQTWATLKKMAFFTEVGAIEASGDRARARCYCREILLLKDGGVRKVVGVYEDELVREQGVWLFARRDYRLFIDESRGDESRGGGERPSA
jgi:ketosteroid isomerase-like protein